MAESLHTRILFVALLACASLALPGSSVAMSAHRGQSPPKIIQVIYEESDDGSSPARALSAFVRRKTNVVRFSTKFGGEDASAVARYREDITDTDIHGERASHPWRLRRGGEGKDVLRLVHRSLFERGFANVTVKAKRDGNTEDNEFVRIELAECSQDPPLYPVSCEIKV